MPKVNFMSQSLKLVRNPQEERRTLARELFLRKPGMTLTDIAKEVGIHRKQVARWRDQEGWKFLKIDADKERNEKLFKGVETPQEAAIAMAKLARKIRKGIAERVAGRSCRGFDPYMGVRQLQGYLVVLNKVYVSWFVLDLTAKSLGDTLKWCLEQVFNCFFLCQIDRLFERLRWCFSKAIFS